MATINPKKKNYIFAATQQSLQNLINPKLVFAKICKTLSQHIISTHIYYLYIILQDLFGNFYVSLGTITSGNCPIKRDMHSYFVPFNMTEMV